MDEMREGNIYPDGQIISLILKMMDIFRDGVEDISKGKSGEIKSALGLLQLIDDLKEDSAGNFPDTEDIEKDKENEGQKVESEKNEEIPKDSKSEKNKMLQKNNQEQKTSGTINKSIKNKDIRVSLDKVDNLVDLVGELALAKMMVVQNPDLQKIDNLENFDRAVHQLNRIVSDLQYTSMSLRMVPIAATFKKMVRLVHDLSYKFNKKVKLETIGEETEIDKTVVDLIADPLVHLVRNAIDHGIEPVEERNAIGKPKTGKLIIEAKHEAGEVWIVIKDDGRGLDREKILEKAISSGLINTDGSNLTDEQVYKLIFEPGFSTAKNVTEISGRGVGMDVVRKNLEKIKGIVDIDSTKGRGTTFTLRIPLTLALMDGMLIQVGDSKFIIPLESIKESFRPKKEEITVTMDGQEIVKLRNELIPVIRLHELYDIEPLNYELEKSLLVTLEHERGKYCLAVDELLGQQQAVIKGLSEYIGNVEGVSGCTILGNGQVSLILDAGTIYELAKNKFNGKSKSIKKLGKTNK